MACNRPLPAWRAKTPNPDTGRVPVTFVFNEADTSQPVEVPCGRCMGCRIERGRTWATRLMHEAKLHRHNYFVTLTYDDDNLHYTDTGLPTLYPQDFTLFMKRLRRQTDDTIRYYQCGEYGENTQRPHHHAILFNCRFSDLRQVSRARNAHALYTSRHLESIWQQGMVSLGAVTFETAAYVASYVTKKFTARNADDHLAHYRGRVPEYATMSRRPGIAKDFIDKFITDVYPSDEVIAQGHPRRPPKYYDTILERRDPDTYQQVKDARILNRKGMSFPDSWRHRDAKEAEALQRIRRRDFK